MDFNKALNRLKNTGRAKAPAGLFAGIEAKILQAKIQQFNRRELYALAAAAALVLTINLSALLYQSSAKKTAADSSYLETTANVFNTYELYE